METPLPEPCSQSRCWRNAIAQHRPRKAIATILSRWLLISYWLELFSSGNAVAVLHATLDQVNEFFELSYDRQGLSNAYRIGDDPSQLQYNRRHLGRYSSNLALIDSHVVHR